MRANIPIENLSTAELLEDWAWLIQKSYSLVAMNNFGDMFLRDENGAIHFLELVSGTITKIAESAIKFEQSAKETENRRTWFLTILLTELEQAGMTLAKGQCFGYKIPPILGGKIEVANIEVGDISVYVSLLGQIHQQVRSAPPGTKIGGFKIR